MFTATTSWLGDYRHGYIIVDGKCVYGYQDRAGMFRQMELANIVQQLFDAR